MCLASFAQDRFPRHLMHIGNRWTSGAKAPVPELDSIFSKIHAGAYFSPSQIPTVQLCGVNANEAIALPTVEFQARLGAHARLKRLPLQTSQGAKRMSTHDGQEELGAARTFQAQNENTIPRKIRASVRLNNSQLNSARERVAN